MKNSFSLEFSDERGADAWMREEVIDYSCAKLVALLSSRPQHLFSPTKVQIDHLEKRNKVHQTHSTNAFNKCIQRTHSTNAFNERIRQTHSANAFDKRMQQTHSTNAYNKRIQQTYSTNAYDKRIQQTHSTSAFDKRIQQTHSSNAFEPIRTSVRFNALNRRSSNLKLKSRISQTRYETSRAILSQFLSDCRYAISHAIFLKKYSVWTNSR